MPSKTAKAELKTKKKAQTSSAKIKSTRPKKEALKLPNVLSLSKSCLQILYKNPKQFSIIVIVYLILSLVFVKGLSSAANVSDLKGLFNGIFHGSSASIGTNLSVFGILIGSTGSSNQNSGIFQTILLIIFSLIFIWSIREATKGNKFKVMDAFYRSSYPLIPFILVVALILLETLPMIIGIFLFSTVITNGIAAHLIEKIIWGVISFGLIYLSIYLLISTIFATYIVTLPDLNPAQAIKSAWKLVKKRRFLILRKVIWLPFAILVVSAIITIPFIALLPFLAPWVFFVVSIISVAVVHSYMYNLYRELL